MTDSEAENTDQEDEEPQKKLKINKHRPQKFRREWLQQQEFKSWLASVPDKPYRAKCKFCSNANFTAELSVIRNHASSKTHLKNIPRASSSSQQNIQTFINTQRQETENCKNAKVAEIKLCGFLAEHNISFRTVEHLTNLIKECFPDSKIAKEMQLKRTKATCITTNVIGESEKMELTEILRKTYFSILTDESTDISSVKTACIVVRFYSKHEGKIVSRFWELVQIFGSFSTEDMEVVAATAKHLFKTITETFVKRNVPFTNVIGFGSDGCNTMMGEHNSVTSRFRELCPGICISKCICHSLHLCASAACKTLPRSCEDLCRNIYNFFKTSAKRQCEFKKFQCFLQLEIHKLLRPSQTRWLSLYAVVSRIVEQWEALRLYFTDKWLSERLISAEQIYNALNDPLITLFYLFLEWILPKFTLLNQYFQSDKVVIANLYQEMSTSYTEMLCCYMDRAYVMQTPNKHIDPARRDKFINPNIMYLGVKVMKYLSKPDIKDRKDLKADFYDGCLKFFVTSCMEIKKRFDFNDEILPLLSNFIPANAMSHNTRISTPSLLPIMQLLPRIVNEEDYQAIDDEWRRLPLSKLTEHIDINNDIDTFWGKLLNYESEGFVPFLNLSKFVLNSLSIPHSNAECERVFSKVNLIKTKLRNRLITNTINGTLLANQHVNSKGTCIKFTPSKEMLSRMTKAVLYSDDYDGVGDDEDLFVIGE